MKGFLCSVALSLLSLSLYANAPTADSSDGIWVDLGLPSGLMWADYNVYASSFEEYGRYYAAGETWDKTYYNWEAYTWPRSNNYFRFKDFEDEFGKGFHVPTEED